MPLFETTIPIDHQHVAKLVQQHWGLVLGKLIKASQNHTLEAHSEDKSQKYSVRVTPDPKQAKNQKIKDEIFFVDYLIKGGLKHLCTPIRPKTQPEQICVIEGDLAIVVLEWARGEPIPYMEFRWFKDKQLMRAWGRFFGQMHHLSRKFSDDHGEVAQRIQQWDENHCGILKGSKLVEEDVAAMKDKDHYGVLHGDLNTSNMHYVEDGQYMSVFDTDQVQQGFYLWDIAQAIFGIVALEEGGLPMSGKKVEEANRKEFQDAIVAGYEEEGHKVDRARLDRMVNLKKQLYVKFAKRAFEEGDVPKDMAPFLQWILDEFGPKWPIEA